MGTIRFSLRHDKIDADGKKPIELIYQISGQRKYYRSKEKLKIWSEQWDQDKQQIIYLDKKTAKQILPLIKYHELPSEKEVDEMNSLLKSLVTDIRAIEKRYELDGLQYSSQMVIDRLKEAKVTITKKEDPSNMIFDYIDKYINENRSIRQPGSLSVYQALKNHLAAFQKITNVKISFIGIDVAFFRQFQSFLITKRNLNNTTVAKQLSTLKTFLNYARTEGLKVSEKYRDFKITKPKLEVIALTNEEFEALYNHNLSENKRLAQVRDIFCFACTTGFRYSDLAQLRREHIKADEIRITVKKTKIELSVPLNPYSAYILSKYKNCDSPLPIISNQKLNEYIKELCEIVGINENIEIVREKGNKREAKVYPKYELISVHTGRKTFVTLSLRKGMTAEEVMKISGHENYESFKRYVNITEKQKRLSMHKAWGNPEMTIPLQSQDL